MDGNYENSLELITCRNQPVILKKFNRQERFWCEVNGLLATRTMQTPELLDIRQQKLELCISYICGTTLDTIMSQGIDLLDMCKALADLLHDLHSITMSTATILDQPFNQLCVGQSWLNYLEDRFYRRLNELKLKHKVISDIEYWFWHNMENLDDNFNPVLIHNDLKPSNILIGEDSSLWLIDFDRCAAGDPYTDLARLYWRAFSFDFDRKQYWNEFLFFYENEQVSEQVIQKINFYDALHCMGAVAYYNTFKYHRYLPIAVNAGIRFHKKTGIRIV